MEVDNLRRLTTRHIDPVLWKCDRGFVDMPTLQSKRDSESASVPQNEKKVSRPQLSDDGLLSSDPRWQAVQKISKSQSFSKGARLSALLLYICDRALRDRIDEITEQQIGVHVFGRPTDYNPGDDNIVRGTASQLRQRLALYYQEEGSEDAIRVTVPRGAYIPYFEEISRSKDVPQKAEPVSPVSLGNRTLWRLEIGLPLLFTGTALFLLVGLIGGYGLNLLVARRNAAGLASAPLWRTLFNPQQKTLIVPGDAALNIFSGLAREQVSIEDYSTGRYLSSPLAQTPKGYDFSPIASRLYTSMPDLKLAVALARLPQVVPDRMEIRYARDLRIDDLRSANAILIGAPPFDPWVGLLQKTTDFSLDWSGDSNTFTITNRAPRRGENATYTWKASSTRGYGLIILTDNLARNGKVLIVEGTTIAGVDAAANYLLDADRMRSILDEAGQVSGKLNNFEILLEANFVAGDSPNANVIAKHFHSSNSNP